MPGSHPHGVIIAAPRSGSGKTLLTLGLAAACRASGLSVATAKSGPDYIDAALLSRVAPAITLDAWSMPAPRLRARAADHAASAEMLLIEGAMGLFDGAADGTGSTADLAAALKLPVVLVVDTDRQSQSIAALVHGFVHYRPDIRVAGLILNRVASARHEAMLRRALEPSGLPILGALPRSSDIVLPERHLGLVLPGDIDAFDTILAALVDHVMRHIDLTVLRQLAAPIAPGAVVGSRLPPLGQRIAIAADSAFAFFYRHWRDDWQAQGASLSFFSPLADESPAADADAVLLPGGYPELHAPALAAATRFRTGLSKASARGALIYGECGGYMALGQGLIDADGQRHAMAGLLPVSTDFSKPRRRLGYRRLAHASPLPWPVLLAGHEFHYSCEVADGQSSAPPLFAVTSADGETLAPMGQVVGRVMGSYAHVIDRADLEAGR